MRLLHLVAALVAGLTLAANAAAQTFSLTPGSPTVPPPTVACPPFSAAGDIYLGPLPPAMVLPMGPPGCGLGYPIPGNVDAFSSAFPPPLATDAPADSFFVGPNPALLPFFGPGAMPNSQLFDGDGLAAPPFFFPPAPPTGVLEPFPPGDDVDAIDPAAPATYDFLPVGGDGIPEGFLYYSVDPATAFAGGFLPADVLVTTGVAPEVPFRLRPPVWKSQPREVEEQDPRADHGEKPMDAFIGRDDAGYRGQETNEH